MYNLIDQFGVEITLRSIFPNLKGIVFKDVAYNKILNDTKPLEYLTQNIDDNWYFGQGNMAMIFRSVKLSEKTKILKNLIEANNLKTSEVFKTSSNINFWKGNGFKIEDADIKGQSVIIITNEETFSEENLVLRDTKLATVIASPNWIRGIDKIFDGSSTTGENKNLSNFNNTPLFFKENDDEYIIIPVSTYGISKRIIDRVIFDNGGKNNFNLIDSYKTDEWEYFHAGKIFSIGYLSKQSFIRINALPQTQIALDGTQLERGIHPLSDKINLLIKGLNSPIYNPGEGGVPDGRFYAVSSKANVIVSFLPDLDNAKGKFDQIVLNHNPNDKTLKINNKSIRDFFEENPDEVFEFIVDGKFQLQLSKGNVNYRINLYPGGGLSSDWNFDKSEDDVNLTPESSTSKRIKVSEVISSKTNLKPDAKIENQRKFIEQSTEVINKNKNKNKKIKANNFLNTQKAFSRIKKIKFPYLKRILKFLILFLMFLFIYKACFYDECSNNAVCYYLKAQEAEKNIEYDKAFSFYKKAIRVDRNYIEAFNSRGLLHQKLEKHDKAIRDFSNIIEIDETNWLAFHNRANSYTAQGDKKYSIEYKKAMIDYDKSIELNGNNENGVSFFNRGLLKEKIEVEACDDFVYSCDREYSEGCDRYNNSCYPKNGDFVLFNEFGSGVFANNGLSKIRLDNSRGNKDVVAVIRRYVSGGRDGPRIRAQFIRKGEVIIMENIPNGTYYTQDYYGDFWIKNLDRKKNRFLRGVSFLDYKSQPFTLINKTMKFTYNTSGGAQGDQISEDDFFN